MIAYHISITWNKTIVRMIANNLGMEIFQARKYSDWNTTVSERLYILEFYCNFLRGGGLQEFFVGEGGILTTKKMENCHILFS